MSAPERQACCWSSPSPEHTLRAAAALALCIEAAPGAEAFAIALIGPLGAGKTLFAKGLARGLGLDPANVTSPTFTIASEYPTPGGGRFAHVDLYRIGHPGELAAAGFDDLLTPGSVLAVEWADRALGALPPDHLEIGLARAAKVGNACEPPAGESATSRAITARSRGPRALRVLERWRARIEANELLERCEPVRTGTDTRRDGKRDG